MTNKSHIILVLIWLCTIDITLSSTKLILHNAILVFKFI